MKGQISAEDPILRLSFENTNWLGASRRQLPWDELDDSLFDRIARFIVREDDSLFMEELPDALRERLGREPTARQARPPAERADPVRAVDRPAAQAAPDLSATPDARSASESADSAAIDGPARTPTAASERPRAEATSGKDAVTTPEIPPTRHQEPAPTEAKAVRGFIPAPAPMEHDDFIVFDESKLGLSHYEAEPEFPGLAKPIDPPAANPTNPAPASTGKTDVQPTNPASAKPPEGSNTRETHAAAPSKATQANPAATGSESPPDETVPTAEAIVSQMDDEHQERDAALFRLRMRAMMARLRSEEPDSDKPA
jgi:hypothetical protein